VRNNKIEPNPIKMINPEIISLGKDLQEREEGCLSIPGYNANVIRPSSLTVKYTNEDKKVITLDAKGLLATCIQHEIDHLNGILFIDHISKLKREIILKKAIKEYSKQ
ncbi:MAG: peptide deformylase, partial [Alphaproteobacteria bacterium]|nr:peptide deformylase [Alphaproteobacteria bacterium]